ncbi:MAG: alpha/beta hydrolase [Acidimicrobiia bacterium]
MPQEHITLRGVEFAYDRAGTGPDLVWGHGLTRSRATDDAFEMLGGHAIPATVWRYDARGHGASGDGPAGTGQGWDELARDQLALATAWGLETFVSGGASMGCGTSLHAAVAAPDRGKALLLVIPPTGWETRRAQVDIWGEIAGLVDDGGLPAYVDAFSSRPPPDPLQDGSDPRVRLEGALRGAEPTRIARNFRLAAAADLPDRDAIAQIQAPTLILAWTGDPAHPDAIARELADLVAGAALHVASSPDELTRWPALTRSFLADVG